VNLGRGEENNKLRQRGKPGGRELAGPPYWRRTEIDGGKIEAHGFTEGNGSVDRVFSQGTWKGEDNPEPLFGVGSNFLHSEAGALSNFGLGEKELQCCAGTSQKGVRNREKRKSCRIGRARSWTKGPIGRGDSTLGTR